MQCRWISLEFAINISPSRSGSALELRAAPPGWVRRGSRGRAPPPARTAAACPPAPGAAGTPAH